MTKESYEKYEGKTAVCSCCGRTVDIKFASYRYLRSDGILKRCPICDWKVRHGSLPEVEGFTADNVEFALEFLLFEKSELINDLADSLDIDIDDALRLVRALNVGNKRFRVKCTCAFCGKEIIKMSSVYTANKFTYCSRECYWEHKSIIMPKGEESPFYKRVITNCSNCDIEISVKPYRTENINEFGDSHIFCSPKCYWAFRSKYYTGAKASQYGVKHTAERREAMRKTILENARNGSRFNSGVQLAVNSLLDKNSIVYNREHIIQYYAVDNYLVDSGLVIEVMGDYWHTSPLRYNDHKYKINEIQQRTLQHDKQKHAYINNHLGVEILYIWEKDITHRLDVCERLILEYINNNGVLTNYHSFNYRIEDGSLMLNNDIIVPYQDKDIETYRHLFVNKAS